MILWLICGNASAIGKLSLYTHVPALLEACGHKEKPADKVASALLTTMYAACLTWSGAYVLPFLKEGLQAKAKPEIKIVTCDVLGQLAAKYAVSTSLEIEWCVHLLSILPSLSPSRTSRLSQPGLVFPQTVLIKSSSPTAARRPFSWSKQRSSARLPSHPVPLDSMRARVNQ